MGPRPYFRTAAPAPFQAPFRQPWLTLCAAEAACQQVAAEVRREAAARQAAEARVAELEARLQKQEGPLDSMHKSHF